MMISNEPIAVIGSANRFPGGLNSPSKLWEFLKRPVDDLQSKIPKERFDIDAFYHPDGSVHGRTNARHGYFLREKLTAFDAPFFNIQAGEAESIDPQQRLLLETTFEAVASAGLRMQELRKSRTAVYVGLMTHDAGSIQMSHQGTHHWPYVHYETNHAQDHQHSPTYLATGSAISITSNRISYFFDWHGPSMTVDTACSSSLVAVQLAAQQLRSGDSNLAVAAGANIILSPLGFISESKLSMLSPTGRSRMWDAAADGYARGEGVAALVLKTLSQAIRDGDHIECIIRETGVNQDGRTTGITMPSHQAQEALIRETYAKAGLDLARAQDRPQFFEAHGTGTGAGDPQEAEAISTAFFPAGKGKGEEGGLQVETPGNGEGTPSPLFVGSIKTVIGHTESTAGIAGILKASLAVQDGVIPPNFFHDGSFNLSPRVAPFYQHLCIPKEAQPWPKLAPGQPRRASVNSFGFGGTNAHAIVEHYDPAIHNRLVGVDANGILTVTTGNGPLIVKNGPSTAIATDCFPLPLVLSANTTNSMQDTIASLLNLIKTPPREFESGESDWSMVDLAWTLARKTSVMPVRRAMVATGGLTLSAHDRTAAHDALATALEDDGTTSSTLGQSDRDNSSLADTTTNRPRLLGVFTGQGAQWPGMMKTLVSSMSHVRTIIHELDHSLQTLPAEYKPSWTLEECFALSDDDPVLQDRLTHPAFSMPLCTAVQVVQLRLLLAARVELGAVVGHSGGETACALAAGLISERQAIRIAYLRGLVTARHAVSPQGKDVKGGMLAAHTSYEDALELCGLRELKGRVVVGCVNAPSGVTFAGDVDAIEKVKAILEEEDKWCRVLKVGGAYHSPHVLPCEAPYIAALVASGCAVGDASDSDFDYSGFDPGSGSGSDSDFGSGSPCRVAAAWYSSAYEGNKRMSKSDVTAEYWAHNFVSPVLFMQAVEKAVSSQPPVGDRPFWFGAVVEVGCHPALKQPCLAIMEKLETKAGQVQKNPTSKAKTPPYVACMQRGGSDVDAFAGFLGFLWEQFGEAGFDADSFIATTAPGAAAAAAAGAGGGGGKKPEVKSLASVLPRYAWDHSREYRLYDSRTKHAFLRPGSRPHLLLGKQLATSSNTVFQWRNVVRPLDHSWLEGHVLQGQTLFPAAGYVTMALEAAMQVLAHRHPHLHIRLIEVLDMKIDKAVSFGDENSLAELVFTAKMVAESDLSVLTLEDTAMLQLDFTIDSCLARESKLSTSAAGRLVVTCARGGHSENDGEGVSMPLVLPPAHEEHPHMHEISVDSFYRELGFLDYTYAGHYRGIQAIRRGDGKASGTIAYPVLEDVLEDGHGHGHRLVVHPASMDLALQGIIATYTSPGDQRLRGMHVPVGINRVALVPSLCLAAADKTDTVDFNAVLHHDKGDYMSASTQVFWAEPAGNRSVLYQVDGLMMKPLTAPSASDDHLPFTKTVWGPLDPDPVLDNPAWRATDADREVQSAIERVVHCFIKDFLGNMKQKQLSADDKSTASAASPFHHQRYMAWCEHVLAEAPTTNPWYHPSWETDTVEEMKQLCARYPHHHHMRMVERVQENMLSIMTSNVRDKDSASNPFQFMDHDGLLTESYSSTTTFGPQLLYLQEAVSQIAHRHQCMDILEVGAGTGGATRRILQAPQLGFNSYTYTDISPSFFEAARAEFGQHDDRFEFRVLDVRQPPHEQGFTPYSYDLVIAHNVLHATPRLDETMANVRSLLKPGGYIAINEGTHMVARNGFIFGLFPDWWAGYGEGRVWEPFISLDEWDAVLRRTGWSGVETRTADHDALLFPTSVFTSRALGIDRLAMPLAAPRKAEYPPLVIVGGESPVTRRVVDEMRVALPHRDLRTVKCLTDLLLEETSWIADQSTFVVLSELDKELFTGLDEEMFQALKQLCAKAGRILWLTQNAWIDHPLQAMTFGLVRTLRLEYEDVPMQILDVDSPDDLPLDFLTGRLLCLEEATGTAALDPVENITWTWEPEVWWSGGRAWLPRSKKDTERNDRVNSERRVIMATASPATTPVSLRGPGFGLYLEPAVPGVGDMDMDMDMGGVVTIHAHYSVPNAIRVGTLGFFHLVQGVVAETGKAAVALAASNTSIVRVPARRVFTFSERTDQNSHGEAKCLLLHLSASLVAHGILSGPSSSMAPEASILALEPPAFCQDALAKAAKSRHVQLYFATTYQARVRAANDAESGEGVPWIQLHQYETEDSLRHKLPGRLAAVYDFSTTTTTTTTGGSDPRAAATFTSIGARLSLCLPPGCSVWSAGQHLVQADAVPIDNQHEHEMAQLKLVEQAVIRAAAATSSENPTTVLQSPPYMVAADQLATTQRAALLDNVMIDWRASRQLEARLRPIDAVPLFASDRTFLLAGLGGSLGRALARWMVSRGARHIVLSSRRPEALDPRWTDDLKALIRYGGGGSPEQINITTLAMDVTIEAAVDDGLAHIRQTMPPIGGIALGTMILHDTAFKSMELGEWQSVVRPKVEGARLLHERFSDPAHNLDFFIMFSSATKVTGNPGQSNYCAANSYLQGLTQYRRVRGLTGSTIDIGAVFGAGWLAKSKREEEYLNFRARADTLSVPELQALFAEAVVSGRSSATSSGRSPVDTSAIEITTGIPEFDRTRKGFRVRYFYDPRFGNLRKPVPREQRRGGAEGLASSSSKKIPVREQLEKATTIDEVRRVIAHALRDTLRGTLQISDVDSVPFDPTAPLVDQGVDSLVSMAVTKWFSKELFLTVPVLEILNGASVVDLANDAAARLHPKTIPNVKDRPQAKGVTEEAELEEKGLVRREDEQGVVDQEHEADPNGILRQEQLSIAQEEAWKLQQAYGEDISNTIVGMFMQGPVDLERLAKAWETSLSRHEIFRTAFVAPSHQDKDSAALPVQAIMRVPASHVQLARVADREAAEQELKDLSATHRHDVAAGKTVLVVIYHWPGDDNGFLLVVGYHRLVGDGSTTENLFLEVGQLYNGTELPPPPQYCALAAQQRAELTGGHLDADVQYWHDPYQTPSPPPPLPVMHLPQAQQQHAQAQPLLGSATHARLAQHHEATARVPPMVAFRIRSLSRAQKATAMHFYLAAYHVLLARLAHTQTADMAIGIADTGRSTADQLAAMGPFANTLPVRMPAFNLGATAFVDALAQVRDRLRHWQAAPHAHALLSASASSSSSSGALSRFQAVFDYRQGATESGRIGGAGIVDTVVRRAAPPSQHVLLEVSDDPTKEGPQVTAKLLTALYGPADAKTFVDAYLGLLARFSSNSMLRVEEGEVEF